MTILRLGSCTDQINVIGEKSRLLRTRWTGKSISLQVVSFTLVENIAERKASNAVFIFIFFFFLG